MLSLRMYVTEFDFVLRKMKDSGSLGADAQRAIAEFEPRVDLSMGRKIIEIP